MRKKFFRRILTGGFAFGLIASMGITLAQAKNLKEDRIKFYFDEIGGNYMSTTDGRAKDDTSYGFINGNWADNDYPFEAYMVAAAGNSGAEEYIYYDDSDGLPLFKYNVYPGQVHSMANLIKESGYDYAALRGESMIGDVYTVEFLWSPDSYIE